MKEKKMGVAETIRKSIWKTVAVFVVYFLVMGVVGFYKMNANPVKEEYQAYSGVITNKYDTVYSCGSKGRDSCYSRYFVMNGKPEKVEIDTYQRNRVGDWVTLNKPVYVGGHEHNFSEMAGMFLLLLVGIMLGMLFLYWLIEGTDKLLKLIKE